MLIIGYLGALLIGLVLGLIGGGGSILTVPIFVYLLDTNPILATAYSLFVVGIASLVGAIKNSRNNLVDFKTGFIFAIPAFIGVYIARIYLINIIPEHSYINDFILTREMAIMLFFALLMLVAAFFMINSKIVDKKESKIKYKFPLLAIEGLVVGALTGLVGAGGGFLIIPALVLFARLSMKKAVATSLMIIAIKNLAGFLADIGLVDFLLGKFYFPLIYDSWIPPSKFVTNYFIDWSLLILFTSISIVGIFVGLYLNNFIDGKKLKKGFGWFIFIMAISILIKEFI